MLNSIDIKNFESEVIKKSEEIPVLVDFWAPWCQPCRTLGPVLEELVNENIGKFLLAKLNTDEYQEIATRFNIRSIPAVKLFINGQVEMEFTGALPKNNIIKMLQKFLPDENKKELEALKKVIMADASEAVISRLKALVEKATELTEAKVLLAKTILFTQPNQAKELLRGIMEDSPFYHQANSYTTISDILTIKNEQLEENVLNDKLIMASDLLNKQDFDAALDILINIIIVNKSYMDEIARKTCVAIFMYLGNDHEIARKYRRRFDMSLY